MDALSCARCRHANVAGARFCAQCGAALGLACRHCGAALAPLQRFCDACGTQAAATPPAPAEDGERRHATVVFSDLSGYTALAEQLDPEDVERIVAGIRREAVAVVEAHGGIVNQFVGDEVMALFGVPQAGRDDAVRAVRAALALHAAVRAIADDAGGNAPALTLHSGVNTGLVVARPSAQHDGRYNVTGDTVNTAARLLSLAGANEVIVGDDTWREVSGRFDAQALAPAPVKGKQLPLRAHRIAGERERSDAPPLIGRDEELSLATLALQACADRGAARLVVLRGEPGIGKSRLLEELLRLARARGHACRVAQVLDFGPARGRGALRSLCMQLLGGTGAAGADARAALLADAIAAGRIDAAHEPFLCALLDIAPPPALHAALASMDAGARERGELAALVALVRGLCAASPLALALEDTHWAEPATLSQWCQLIGGCATLPVLFVATTRPEAELIDAARRAQLGGVSAMTIDLGPLAHEAARRLVERFGAATEEWVNACIERAAGNPLFLEQLMINAGEAAREHVPGSIQALVLARVDRVGAADKALLQAAAVLGLRFDAAVLPSLLGCERVDLAALLAVGLLRPVEGEHQFVHALIRDGVYESLLKARRRELHTRAAAWFAARDPGLQAEHLDHAESPAAVDAYLAAARQEAARWRHERALTLAARGLQLAQAAGQRHALAMLLGEQLREVGRNREALTNFELARDLAAGDGESFRAWFEIAAVKRYLSEVDGAMQALDAAQAVLSRAGDERDRARVEHLRGNLHFAAGRVAECGAAHQRALAHARAAADPTCEAQALSGLGDACYAAGDMRAAGRHFADCVAICERHGLLRFAIMNRGMIAMCAYFNGDLPLAMRLLPLAAEEAKRLGHVNAQVMIQETLGICLNLRGDYDAALPINSAAVELARSVGARRYEVVASVQLSHTLRKLGRRAEACAVGERAWQLVEQIGAHGFAGSMVLAEWAASSERPDECEALLVRGREWLDRGALAHTHLWYLAAAMALRLDQGRADEAERLADELQRWSMAGSVTWADQHARSGRALAHWMRGERSAAQRQHLEQLRVRADELAYGELAARLG
ncbi:MAG TPA: adenylate/guanylate cyclase domain-containing protein, partial [Burkholderiaceae bacterium]|nr:adenylate/guanylate cyclase domain-containing protein [Burkholderiaceae bacterium]